MCLAILRLMRDSFLPCGSCSRSSRVGASVASAKAAKESMIRLTQSSCNTFSGVSPVDTAATNATIRATKLIVSWNWRNLRMLLNTQRPHMHALTMDEKLSSKMTISAASFATSVPAIPIARPTSASFIAGASFVPSPVTDTTSPRAFRVLTSLYLSSGDERARTSSVGMISMSCSFVSARNSGPSMATPCSVMIPHSLAICFAV
mmetsp:Transcript_12307/g.35035  ORF Transcript_12307/g.35035 Transcript_12307/m.35035 type:complete len:205 (-) Transcript_12307:2124-2738(-)